MKKIIFKKTMISMIDLLVHYTYNSAVLFITNKN